MWDRFFLEHPRSVDESYLEHQRNAFSFAAAMFCGALACFIHGIVPALFTQTGSATVSRLYDRMVVNRVRGIRSGSTVDPRS